MSDLEQQVDVAVDPSFARVQPRWTGARTERNLAATFARIDGARRTRRAGVGALGVACVAAVAVFVGARTGTRPPATALGVPGAPPESRAVAPATATASAGHPAARPEANAPSEERRTSVVGVARVDFKIASARATFKRQVAHRQYAAAYRALVASPEVADASAEGLMLAADAARLSGHAAESVPYFRRLLRGHASDARAPVAAFTMGRILLSELDRPGEAADAFALARRLAPAGALAPDALAREVEAAGRAGDHARARSLAAQYLSRYPAGQRADAVRRAGGLE